MASIKISDLTSTETLTRDDVIPVVNGGDTKKVSIGNLSKNLAEFGEIGFKPVVVDTLPTENIKTNTIYLTPSEDPDETNTYDEWIYSNEKWEKIGTTGVDLGSYYTKEETTNAIIAQLASDGFIVLDLDMTDCEWQTTTATVNNVTYTSRISSRGRNEEAIQESIAKANSKISYLSTIYTEDEILTRLMIVLRNVYYRSNYVGIEGTHIIFSDKNNSTSSTPRSFTGELFDATGPYTSRQQLGFGLTGSFEVNVSTNASDMNNYITSLSIYANMVTNYDVGQCNAVAKQYDIYKNKLDFSKYTYQYIIENNVLGDTSSYYAAPIDNVTFGDTAKMLEFWLINGYTGYGKTGMMVYISRNKNFIAPAGVWYTTLASETATRTYGSWSLETTLDVHIGFSKTTTEEQYTEFMENLQIMIADGTAPIGSYSPYLDGEIATKDYVDDSITNIDVGGEALPILDFSDKYIINFFTSIVSIDDDMRARISKLINDYKSKYVPDASNINDCSLAFHLIVGTNGCTGATFYQNTGSSSSTGSPIYFNAIIPSIGGGDVYYGLYALSMKITGTWADGVFTCDNVYLNNNSNKYLDINTNMNTDTNETISRQHTYTTLPISSVEPTSDTQFTNKKYVDDSIASAITDALGGEY